MACTVCNVSEEKYKCPACRKPYCSLPCYKTHKEYCVPLINNTKESKEETKTDENNSLLTNDTVETNKLEQLQYNEKVRELLKNRHLRELLSLIDTCENAEETMQKAMLEPIFVEFADACLQVVQPEDYRQHIT